MRSSGLWAVGTAYRRFSLETTDDHLPQIHHASSAGRTPGVIADRSADLLRRVLAWRVQTDVHGGLDARTVKMIDRAELVQNLAPKVGMRLPRENAGRVHEVVVLENGVVYEGQTYGSLSEVARLITGQRWNGPCFFGLREANVR
jgi:hypothetical protein